MRLVLFIICMGNALFSVAQTAANITMNGIGELKLGMEKPAVEKLLSQKLATPHLDKNKDEYQDTVHVKYKGQDVDLIFQSNFAEKNTAKIIYAINTKSSQFKTKSGIGIGDDKYKIISTYDSYTLWLMPDYENETKSKTKSQIWLHGDDGNVIMFHLEYNKVTSIEVTYFEGD